MTQNCILADKRKDGCAECNPRCQHRIALVGLNGDGGRVAAANLPKEYRHITLANSPARTEQAKVYTALERYADLFTGGTEKSAYLWSESPGTGKTTSAAALAIEWITRQYIGALRKGEQPAQLLAYFLDVNAFQRLYTGFTRGGIPKEVAEKNSAIYYQQMAAAERAPFAVFDDIGVRSDTEGFRGDLHAVINYRVTNGLPSVYTSNLPIKEMATVFDARLYDRIRDNCGEIHFEGASKRGRR